VSYLRVLSLLDFDPTDLNFLSVLLGGRNTTIFIRHYGKFVTSGPLCCAVPGPSTVPIPAGGSLTSDVFIAGNTSWGELNG